MIYKDLDEKASSSQYLEHSRIPRKLYTTLYPLTCCLPFKSRPSLLYQPISSPNFIHLLQIHAGKPGTEIKCSLRSVLLDETLPQYEALSYVWGSTEGQQEIWLDGSKKRVNVNLYEALKRLKKTTRKRTVWIDALCINQDDIHEKGNQVGLMSDIYSRATKVLVWLGTDDYDEAERAFEILRVVVNTDNKSKGKKTDWDLAISKVSTKIKGERSNAAPPLGSRAWIPVMAFFTNTWFQRMWVLQEIALAHSAIFIWGATQLDWKIIESALSVITSDSKLHAMLESRELQNAVFMSHLRTMRLSEMKPALSFLRLLDRARSFNVTDAKDKVYGALGIVTSSSPDSSSGIFVRPDYSSSVATIYTSVALTLISESGNLDVLSFTVHMADEWGKDEKGDENTTDDHEKIPSWVPDWNSKTIIYPLLGLGAKNRHSTGTSRPLHLLPTSHPGELSVKGLILDRVSEVCVPVSKNNITESGAEVKRLVEWCSERQARFAQPSTFPPTPLLFTEASLASVLAAGRKPDGTLVTDPVQHKLDFIAYYSKILLDLEQEDCVSRTKLRGEVKGQIELENNTELHSRRSLESKPEYEPKPNISTPNSTNLIARSPIQPVPTAEGRTCNPDAAREAIFRATCYRSLFTTSSGKLGLGPSAMKEGDIVVALWGAQVPFVLRRVEGGGRYRFVGECYVEQYMNGVPVEKFVGSGDVEEEVFELR
jgi:hypothetical protein